MPHRILDTKIIMCQDEIRIGNAKLKHWKPLYADMDMDLDPCRNRICRSISLIVLHPWPLLSPLKICGENEKPTICFGFFFFTPAPCLSFSFASFFCLLSLSIFLHPKKTIFVKSACVLLFPCVSLHWWVHFPRSVLFCQPHQQLFTHSSGNSFVLFPQFV